ncbi:hypothetical protein [Companilactobacillus halodurans]|uniref:Lipoprotein n=1 Tax=Companilactobacillus halodurans TaxID=2584183 RepID=A0A5P0ZNB4_9LACO|nr:hypothetical protein [Companilactobacillus halodurans]MQS75331.1 hypothetical protein [Companilactobacillus halodurans]MQS97408.1 hypothetical protein [Companilactobacillus halodurans]
MKKKLVALTTLLIGVGLFGSGCSNAGNVNISNDPKLHKVTKAEKKKNEQQEKKDLKQRKKQQKKQWQESLGKEYKYGLIKGPSWLYVYENGKKTDGHLDPDTTDTVKLHEHSKIQLGGELPDVGTVKTRTIPVAGGQSKIDDEDKYDRELNLSTINDSGNGLHFILCNLKGNDYQAISNLAFTDLPKYLDALSTNDSSKLPNQSKQLLQTLDGNNNRGDASASYQVMEQYFNKKSAQTENEADLEADDATYLEIGDDQIMDLKNATQLFVQTFAKVKKTDTDQHALRIDDDSPKYGSSKTEIEEYQMDYQLVDNKWQLISVVSEGESDYSMDTSKSNWIVQKN